DLGTWQVGSDSNSNFVSTPSGTYLATPWFPSTSPADPFQVSVLSPTAGALAIGTALVTGGSVGGYTTLDTFSSITTPPATVTSPLLLTFVLNTKLIGTNTPDTIRV